MSRIRRVTVATVIAVLLFAGLTTAFVAPSAESHPQPVAAHCTRVQFAYALVWCLLWEF